ncbi:MAG: DUF4159 domain-containing protein, partial [Planctomycetota bacterium]|nr:DUF4159 domain-containing protein [Planctomycetota bacterium]
LALCCCGAMPAADEDAWLRPLGPPPKAKPKRISGGESFPPLPLPVTPLRRSERKREPSPPKLLGKVVWGAEASYTWESGDAITVSDWNQCPGDTQSLMQHAGQALGVTYGHETVTLASFHFDPEKMPLLLFSGSRRIQLAETERLALRRYVQDGGMLVFDSVAGSPWFHQTAVQEAAAMFPDQRLRAVPLDHPLLHMVYDTSTVSYKGAAEGDQPRFQAIYIGSRIGILLSPYGLGTGWDGRDVYGIEQAAWYSVDSARKLGINLVAYAIGYAEAGRIEARPELHGSEANSDADELVFAQLRHDGAWNVHPGAAAALMMRARRDLALDVGLRRVAVDAGHDDLSRYGLLYLTALDEFHFSDAELAAIRRFLDRHGTLIINNGLGLPSSDQILRREIARLLPDAELAPVDPAHPVFNAVFPTEQVRYTPAVIATDGALTAPVLEAIAIDGDLRVLYAPISIEAAWLGCEYPMARAYAGPDGVRMGLNLLLYAATH